jgi:hypothetical protein
MWLIIGFSVYRHALIVSALAASLIAIRLQKLLSEGLELCISGSEVVFVRLHYIHDFMILACFEVVCVHYSEWLRGRLGLWQLHS